MMDSLDGGMASPVLAADAGQPTSVSSMKEAGHGATKTKVASGAAQ
jgi:hypothetical protein